MDWIIITTVFLSVLRAAFCFNIDPVAWKSLTNDAAGFGYQVVQRTSGLLVSAPLAQQPSGGRGQIFQCSTTSCYPLSIQLPEFAVNSSFGLMMVNDPSTTSTLICGPTIPKDCQSITMYSGICVELHKNNLASAPMPSSPEECRSQADIAFLLDGSGSVSPTSFITMKQFVQDLVSRFVGKDTQFAIAQFSTDPVIHYYFNTFDARSWRVQINGIRQLRGWTFTAKAIQHVVNEVFSPFTGSRPNTKKILIVITDGESNDNTDLHNSINLAERKRIVRFAIGVGDAFRNSRAKQELDTIASQPSENHVFQVENFNALEKIRENLQDKIFAIEGSQSGGDSLKMEMAQEGFSAAYVPGGGLQTAVVGANLWRGGYMKYTNRRMRTSYEPTYMKPDSYLGYSMAVANTPLGPLTIIGAPRYNHIGVVMVIDSDDNHKKIDPHPWQFQSGEYFGAEVCAMDVNRDTFSDLVLISAPMYIDDEREGRVYVCIVSGLNVDCHLDSPTTLRGHASEKGRFGSSLAVLSDINADGFHDFAVGAPLENNGQGSIYIFHGEGGGSISQDYSQRIAGSEVKSGLKFFGSSICQSSGDFSDDSLPDLAVGAKGTVVLLRSKPIVMVEAEVTFTPSLIPTQNVDCSNPLMNKANICFTMTRHSTVKQALARINFTLTLDATRKVPKNRASIDDKERVYASSLYIKLVRPHCVPVTFSVQACPEDAFNALSNELKFTFEGLPSSTNLRPSLALQAQTTTIHPLGFEIDCGTDKKCVDELMVDFNFSSSVVKVGIDELLNVTISVANAKDNSYNARVIVTYPAGLSYRKFTVQQGRIECSSYDSEDGLSQGKTECSVDKPILKSKAKVLFTVSYGIDASSQLDRQVVITANASSGNQEHSPSSQLYKMQVLDAKYSIFASIESSLSYNNFSYGKNDLQKPVQQSIVVTNDIRELNFTVVIKVPIKLGDKDIWADVNSLQFPDCQTAKELAPKVRDYVQEIKKSKVVGCSVARCKVFRCSRFMGRLESRTYILSANLSSGWIEQIGLASAKFIVTSTASLEYDENQYIFFSTGSTNNPPIRKIETEVEVYAEPNFTKEIIGGSLGGLVFLILLTAGLYKAGFFKSKYKDLMNEDAQADQGGEGGEPPAEEIS